MSDFVRREILNGKPFNVKYSAAAECDIYFELVSRQYIAHVYGRDLSARFAWSR